ncbi:MAG: cation-translocating P-type ATPase, partial [Pseudomonadota bacterium]
YIFAVHFPIIGLSLVPLLLGWPAMFAPVHIVFLEMIINPACSIAFEAEPAESNIMQRPPRPPKELLFGKDVFFISLLQGISLLLASLLVMSYALNNGATAEVARAMTFTTLVTGNLGLILVNRSWRHSVIRTLNIRNPALWWVIIGAFVFLVLALLLPILHDVFHFAPITIQEFSWCYFAGLASVMWFELYKVFRRNTTI